MWPKAVSPQVKSDSITVSTTPELPIISTSTPPTIEEMIGDKKLYQIAWCESRLRQFKNGEVLRGIVNQKDVGILQINETYHKKEAEAMGIDIYTLEGNIKFGKYLYRTQGTQPWSASESCWLH